MLYGNDKIDSKLSFIQNSIEKKNTIGSPLFCPELVKDFNNKFENIIKEFKNLLENDKK